MLVFEKVEGIIANCSNSYHFVIREIPLVDPVETALRAVPGRMIALESPAKCLIPLTVPDRLYWFLEDVPQHALLLILSGALMSERSKTTREHIPARSDVSQRVRTPATRPGTVTKIPYQALQASGGACRIEIDATSLPPLLPTRNRSQFHARSRSHDVQ